MRRNKRKETRKSCYELWRKPNYMKLPVKRRIDDPGWAEMSQRSWFRQDFDPSASYNVKCSTKCISIDGLIVICDQEARVVIINFCCASNRSSKAKQDHIADSSVSRSDENKFTGDIGKLQLDPECE